MPVDRGQLETALRNAHAAGHTEQARALARALAELPAGQEPSFGMTQRGTSVMSGPGPTTPIPRQQTPKTEVPPGEFIWNQAKQGVANLGAMVFDRPALTPEDMQVSDYERALRHTEQGLGVRPNLTTPRVPARIAGRAAEYGIGGAPFAAIGPLAYGTSTLGAAVGDVIGEDIAGEGGRMVGAITGSFLTPASVINLSVLAGRKAIQGIKMGREAMAPGGAQSLLAKSPYPAQVEAKLNSLAESAAGNRLSMAIKSNPKSEQTIAEFNRYLDEVEKITGTRPDVSLADVLQHPDLLEGQQLIGGSSVERLNAAQLRRNVNEQNLQSARQAVVGQGDSFQVLDSAAKSIDDQTASLTAREAMLSGDLDKTMAPLRETVDPAASGARIRNIVDAERQAVKGQFDNTFGRFRGEAASAQFNVTPLVDKIQDLADDLKAVLDPKEHPTLLRNIDRISERWAEGGQTAGRIVDASGAPLIPGQSAQTYTASLEDVWDNLQTLTSEISDLQTRVRANPNALRKLSEVVDTILDDVMVHGAKDPKSAQMAEKLKDLRTQYRMEYIQRFKIGQTKALNVKSSYDDMLVSNEKVVQDYLGSDENLGRLIAAVGDNPEAMQLTDDAIMAFYAGKVTPNATNFRTASHNTFMQRYGATLKKHRPDLYKAINKTGVDADSLIRNLKTIEKEKMALARDPLIPLLQNQNIEGVVTNALKGPKNMTDLMKRTGVSNRENLRAVILNQLTSDLPEGTSIASRLADKNVDRALRVLYGSDYDKTIGQIKAISAVWEIMENPTTYRLSPSAYNETRIQKLARDMGVPPLQIFSALRAMGRSPAYASGGWFASVFGGQMASAVARQKMEGQMRDLQRLIMTDKAARDALLKSMRTGDAKALDSSGLLRQIRHGAMSAAKGTAKSAVIRGGVPASAWMGETDQNVTDQE